jgi:hypothetical protein
VRKTKGDERGSGALMYKIADAVAEATESKSRSSNPASEATATHSLVVLGLDGRSRLSRGRCSFRAVIIRKLGNLIHLQPCNLGP